MRISLFSKETGWTPNRKRGENFTRTRAIILTSVILASFLVLAAASANYKGNLTGDFAHLISDPTPANVQTFLVAFDIYGPVVLIYANILAAVVPPIPNFVFPIVAGITYGVVVGTLITIVGTAIGAAIAFIIARKLGRPYVERFFGGRNLAGVDRFFER